MENAQPRNQAEPSAPNSAHFKPRPHFTGKEMRCLDRLWMGHVMRRDLDDIIGATNSPDTIMKLREKGVSIDCEDVPMRNRDGRWSYPGRYALTNRGRDLLRSWGWV